MTTHNDVVFGIPLDDGHPNNRRARFGPYAFRAATKASPRSHGVAGARLRAAGLRNLCDIGKAGPENLRAVQSRLAGAFRAAVRPVILGGDKGIAAAGVAAATDVYESLHHLRFRSTEATPDYPPPEVDTLTINYTQRGQLLTRNAESWGICNADFGSDKVSVLAARIQAQVGLHPLYVSTSVETLSDPAVAAVTRLLRSLEFCSLVVFEVVDVDPFGELGKTRLHGAVELAREGLQLLRAAPRPSPPDSASRGSVLCRLAT